MNRRGLISSALIVVAVVSLFLALVTAPRKSELVKAAETATEMRYGAPPSVSREVTGTRGEAVCGEVGGRQFVYRAGTLTVQGDEVFPAVFTAWCARP